MIELIVKNKQKRLYQWNTGRKIRIECVNEIEIHEIWFSNVGMQNALVVAPYEENGMTVAEIPNILLQESKRITAFAVSNTENGQETICGESFSVTAQAKPDDYVYTETEILSYKALAERTTEQLEVNNVQTERLVDAVNSVDKYIGEYEVRELMFEITEETRNGYNIFDIPIDDIDFAIGENVENCIIEYSVKPLEIYLYNTDIPIWLCGMGKFTNLGYNDEIGLSIYNLNFTEIYNCNNMPSITIRALRNLDFDSDYNEVYRSDGSIKFWCSLFNVEIEYIRIYKITKSLGSRIAQIIDEINREVV